MSKQDRQGARTVSDLERKYAFKKSFSDVMGIASDSQKAASEAKKTASETSQALNTFNTDLDQAEVFNRLTKNGEAGFIYMDGNGNIFINASYIKSGKILSVDGKTIFDLDSGKITVATPANETDAANKKYVDDKISSLETRIKALEEKLK